MRLNESLLRHIDSITLNMNDTFGYASADSEDIDVMDLDKLCEMERMYGHDGLVAMVSKIRGTEPLGEIAKQDKFKEALFYLRDWETWEKRTLRRLNLKKSVTNEPEGGVK